jgi:hypothetical protein
MQEARFSDGESVFSVRLPPGWEAERDEEGGVLIVAEEGAGLLHLIPFARETTEELDPAEELYAFLEEQEIELEEDEVEDIPLGEDASLALCEYLAEEGDEEVYWLVGVATAPGQLLFASYSCAAGEEEGERETVRGILGSIVLGG